MTTNAKKGKYQKPKTEARFKLVIKFIHDTGSKPAGWTEDQGNPLRPFYNDTLQRCYVMAKKFQHNIELAMIYDLTKSGKPEVAKYTINNQWNNPVGI